MCSQLRVDHQIAIRAQNELHSPQEMSLPGHLLFLLGRHFQANKFSQKSPPITTITTYKAAKWDVEVRVYNVRKHITPDLTPFLMAAKLTNTPELGGWLEQGTGEAVCAPLGPLLVVRHNRAGHEKIAELVK
ncbi:MAG: hypothetical protein H6824_23995 [Planctomycetaceae bacterium]|nr:hypothetical protein [Planctomycetaceae bacterium]